MRHVALAIATLAACVDAPAEGGAELDIDKDTAAATVAGGKADWAFDVCHVMGWYGDGECDRFCPTLDDDCALPRPPGLDLRDAYALPGKSSFPESVAFDEARKQFYVGSLEKGNLTRVHADGRVEEVFAGTGEAKRMTLGVKFDAPRDRVVVCSYLQTSPATGRIWLFDAATGRRTHDIDLAPAATNASCSDVLVDEAGDILVTDRELPNIYKVRPSTGQATLWTTHPTLAKPRVGIGQNGIALSQDGSALIVTKFLPGKLVRIDRANPRDVREIELRGDHPLPQFLAGADGMVRLGAELYVTFGSSLLRVRSSDGWRTARMERFELGDKICAVTVAQGQLYTLQSDIPQFVLPGSPAPFAIERFDPRWFDQ